MTDPFFKHKHLFVLKFFMDYDGNGFISAEDLDCRAEKMAMKRCNGQQDEGMIKRIKDLYEKSWKGLLDAVDVNKDGSISAEEWLSFHDNISNTTKSFEDLPPVMQNFLDKLFEEMDLSGDGSIDVEEYKNLLEHHELDTSKANEMYDSLLNDTDKANGKIITRERFRELIYDCLYSKDPFSKGKYFFGPYDSYTLDYLEKCFK